MVPHADIALWFLTRFGEGGPDQQGASRTADVGRARRRPGLHVAAARVASSGRASGSTFGTWPRSAPGRTEQL